MTTGAIQPMIRRSGLQAGLIVALLLSLWCRSLIPQGFMPDMTAGKAMRMAICHGGGDDGVKPYPKDGIKTPCSFAGAVYIRPVVPFIPAMAAIFAMPFTPPEPQSAPHIHWGGAQSPRGPPASP